MRLSRRVLLIVCAAAGEVLTSCGSDDPTRVDRPPVVSSYEPGNRLVNTFVGDTLTFHLEAFDPDRDRLSTSFLVDGGRMASGTRWDYVVPDTGEVTIRGVVSDGAHSSYIEWVVSRHEPINLPPVIEAVLPIEANPTMVINDRMDFAIRAKDPEAKPLYYTFTVNDSLVVEDNRFTYQPGSVGMKHVLAAVTDGVYFASREWFLKVTEVPDTIAPAQVTITQAVSGANPGEVYLEWLAVGRDGNEGLASEYQVRTAPEPILTEQDWARASQRPGVPAPVSPGQTMSMTVGGLPPARLTYVTVRALDDFGNASLLGDSPSVMTRGLNISGRVIDALTGSGIAGATVSLSYHDTVTDATGGYSFSELEPVTTSVVVRDETGAGVGAYFDVSMTYTVTQADVLDLYMLPNYPLVTTLYTDFLQFFRAMTDVQGIPYGAQQRRWQLPITLYIRPYSRELLNYGETIARVAGEFDDIVGKQVFNIISTRPAEGVETNCRDDIERDNYSVTEWTSDWYPRLALIEFRTVYTPPTEYVLARTARHEMGHALGLGHSLDTAHLMVGGPAPQVDTFTADEIAVIRCLYTIPRGWDNRRFVRN